MIAPPKLAPAGNETAQLRESAAMWRRVADERLRDLRAARGELAALRKAAKLPRRRWWPIL
jgi:hypothetical protein